MNCPRNRREREVLATSLISLNPFSESLLAASVSERPFSELTSARKASSLERLLIFMARLQENEVAGRLPKDFLNRIALEQGGQETSFAGAHDDEVMPFGEGLDGDVPGGPARQKPALMLDILLFEVAQEADNIR